MCFFVRIIHCRSYSHNDKTFVTKKEGRKEWLEGMKPLEICNNLLNLEDFAWEKFSLNKQKTRIPKAVVELYDFWDRASEPLSWHLSTQRSEDWRTTLCLCPKLHSCHWICFLFSSTINTFLKVFLETLNRKGNKDGERVKIQAQKYNIHLASEFSTFSSIMEAFFSTKRTETRTIFHS